MRKWITKPMRVSSAGYILSLCSVAALLGCSTVAPPRDTVAAADIQVKQALNSKASGEAPLDLRMAVDKLDKAKVAMTREEYTTARRLAEEALVDAQVAEAKASSEQAQQAAREARRVLDSLQSGKKG